MNPDINFDLSNIDDTTTTAMIDDMFLKKDFKAFKRSLNPIEKELGEN